MIEDVSRYFGCVEARPFQDGGAYVTFLKAGNNGGPVMSIESLG